MRRDGRTWLLLSLCGLSVLMSGCVSRLAKYDVEVKADESLADAQGIYPSIEVHLMALNSPDSQIMDKDPCRPIGIRIGGRTCWTGM